MKTKNPIVKSQRLKYEMQFKCHTAIGDSHQIIGGANKQIIKAHIENREYIAN